MIAQIFILGIVKLDRLIAIAILLLQINHYIDGPLEAVVEVPIMDNFAPQSVIISL